MTDTRETVFTEIAAELGDQTGIAREAVTLGTRLSEDLDFWGDDVDEFLEWYVSRFGVDLTGFRFRDHFRERGFEPLSPLYILGHLSLSSRLRANWQRIEAARAPITIDHLVSCALAGRWQHPLSLDPALDRRDASKALNPLSPGRLSIAIIIGIVFVIWLAAAVGALFMILVSEHGPHSESDPWTIAASLASLGFLGFYVTMGWRRARRVLEDAPS